MADDALKALELAQQIETAYGTCHSAPSQVLVTAQLYLNFIRNGLARRGDTIVTITDTLRGALAKPARLRTSSRPRPLKRRAR